MLIVVGGPQYRVGSHRQFALLARSLAAQGIPAMRFDYRGMGDSGGEARTFEEVGLDLRAAIDHFIATVPGMREVVIWGLCDAASAALFYGAGDARVCGLVLLNPWVRTSGGHAKATLKHYYLDRLLQPALWRKIVSGRFDLRRRAALVFRPARRRRRQAGREPAGRPAADAAAPLPDRMLAGLAGFKGKVLLILSGRDLTAQEFSDLAKGSQPVAAPAWRQPRHAPLARRGRPHVFAPRMARPGIRMDRRLDQIMVKRVLMIAFHFPPLRGSSGIQRTLKFAQYLPQFGWLPVVLSAHPRAYANSGDDQLRDIPAEVEVHRAFALDTSRHLSFKGRYPGFMALPDRWVSWALGAVPAGLRLVRRHRPDVIWSTYPIATAHLIGYALHRLTGIPWVADMRDPMTDEGYPSNPLHAPGLPVDREENRDALPARGVHHAGRDQDLPHALPGHPGVALRAARKRLRRRKFRRRRKRWRAAPRAEHRFTLVHSGVIYPSERDPIPLFEALAALKAQGRIGAATFQLVLRATGHDAYLAELIARCGIGDLVTLAPHVSYRDALAEMVTRRRPADPAGGQLQPPGAGQAVRIPARAPPDPGADRSGRRHRRHTAGSRHRHDCPARLERGDYRGTCHAS